MLATSSQPTSPFRRSPAIAFESMGIDLDAASEAAPATPCLESANVLRGERSIGILHNGSVYGLQVTRQGKLILTK